ncbi:MAG: hypothetical protein HY521_11540 [Proteobacteria bacterium]|nr:hypothetical protein [Pseudomonadota bacterium]
MTETKNQPIGPAYNIPLSQDEIALIGAYILVWNLIESEMESVVMTALGINLLVVDAIMASPHVPTKADIMQSAVGTKIADKAIQADAKKCADAIKKHSNFRNEVVHGRWLTHWPSKEAVSTKRAASKKLVRIKEIEKDFGKLCRLSNRLADLHWRMVCHRQPTKFSLPSPWHGKF